MKFINFEKISSRDWSYWLLFTLEITFLTGILGIASYVNFPSDIPFDKYLSCPFKKTTGYDCLGCGLTRAFISLMHGEMLDVVKYNPMMIIAIPFLLWRIFARLSEILILSTPTLNLSVLTIVSLALSVTIIGILRLILEFCNFIKPLS